MRYFYHDLNTREDDKIWELIDRHGLTGYGAWWVILEELYKAEEDGFQVNATETYLKRLSKELDITDHRVLPRFLDTMAELRLIDPQLWQEHVIYSPSVVARGDRYVEKKLQNRERKQREREKKRQVAQEHAELIHQQRIQQIESSFSHASVTRDNDDVTRESLLNVTREPLYSYPESESESYPKSKSNSEDLKPQESGKPLLPVKQTSTQEEATESNSSVAVSQIKPSKCSANLSKKKKYDAEDLEIFRIAFNDGKPQKWSRCDKLTPARVKRINERVIAVYGDRSLEVWQRALLGARQDPWFAPKNWTMDNFLSSGKNKEQDFVTSLSEKAIESESVMENCDMSEAAFRRRQSCQQAREMINGF